MLEQPLPSRRSRLLAVTGLAVLTAMASAAAWSAQPPAVATARNVQLDVRSQGSDFRAEVALAVDGQAPHTMTLVGGFDREIEVRRESDGTRLDVVAKVSPQAHQGREAFRIETILRRDGAVVAEPQLIVEPGREAVVRIGDEPGDAPGSIAVTFTINPLPAGDTGARGQRDVQTTTVHGAPVSPASARTQVVVVDGGAVDTDDLASRLRASGVDAQTAERIAVIARDTGAAATGEGEAAATSQDRRRVVVMQVEGEQAHASTLEGVASAAREAGMDAEQARELALAVQNAIDGQGEASISPGGTAAGSTIRRVEIRRTITVDDAPKPPPPPQPPTPPAGR